MTGRKWGKPDANHAAVVEALRKIGASVCDLKAVGGGCPDLVVGYKGICQFMEIKDSAKPPSKQKLTDLQLAWHAAWRGRPVVVVRSPQEAVDAVTEAAYQTKKNPPKSVD